MEYNTPDMVCQEKKEGKFGKPQPHSWTKLRIERLKIMSEDNIIRLKAIIPGFEEMRYGLIIRPWKE